MLDDAIVIENLKVSFESKTSKVEAVKGISLTCPSGMKTGIVGESGSGKSLLAMSILQLLPKNALVEGQCHYKGLELYDADKKVVKSIRCKDIALIPQNPFQSLNPVLTIGRQLRETLRRHDPCSKEAAEKRILAILEAFGFKTPAHIMKAYSFQLSGGMNQRILAVMGLLCRPDWIIADEPTKGLDAVLRKSIYEELEVISKTYTKSVLLITHDLLFAKKFCDKIAVFYRGEMLEWGSCKDIFRQAKHPYTKALIASMPQNGIKPILALDNKDEEVEGGCSFYAYCLKRTASCKVPQALRTLAEGHQVRCCLYD